MQPDIELLTKTADFVVKYGFLAVGLVLILIIAPAIYKLAGAKRLGLGTATFGLAFVIAYGVINLISVVAPQWISAQRVMISGVVLGVPNGQQLQIKSDLRRLGQAYTKREFDAQRANTFNFPFILVTADAPSCLAVAIVSTDKNADNSPLFNISPVSVDDMAPNIEILAEVVEEQDGSALKVWREANGKQTTREAILKPLRDDELGCATKRGAWMGDWSVFRSAFAQSAVSDSDIVERLQSDDVFTRREARIALSERGEGAFELIEKLLMRKDNYRLQLGAVVALAGMPEYQRKKASASLLEKVRSLRNSPDKTMRDAVVQALQEPAFCYQEENTNRQPAGRFLVICHWTKEQCERTRGPNTSPGVAQSACEPVQLAGVSWKYAPGGFEGAWFQYSPSAFGLPFPTVLPRR
jgi:hypothetical protein